ncbi:MAG: Conserved rane protein of unknown function [Devosia sp.]|nr:Conserved rane protein of unknown function [Devosia sp.]
MSVGQSQYPASFKWAGHALGFSLGGFFDGILLHQVLQWHHLLSGLEQARQDIRVLILADGLFHLLMYIVAVVGLWLLWRTRREFPAAEADRLLWGNVLIGFGAWHVLDAILSHWILGIHRIRMDVDNPLFWDVLWLAVFGILPIILAWVVARSSTRRPPRLLSSPLALALGVGIAAALAALPAPGDNAVVVLFRPGTTPAQAMAALQRLDGALLWTDPSGQVWAIDLPSGADPIELYRHGAMLVSNSIVPAGCLEWFSIQA